MEIKIEISLNDGSTTDMEFTNYQDAINFLDAMENREMDERHNKVLEENN